MTVGVAYFDTKRYHIVLLDSPGHRDFVPNMISGATQADAAILVIDATVGAFEAGLDASGGQTKEHAQLIRSFGVDQIIVAVNKMDAVEYSSERFDSIRQKLGTFLRSCGFKDPFILWVPISAMENQNLMAGPSDTRFSWSVRLPLLHLTVNIFASLFLQWPKSNKKKKKKLLLASYCLHLHPINIMFRIFWLGWYFTFGCLILTSPARVW